MQRDGRTKSREGSRKAHRHPVRPGSGSPRPGPEARISQSGYPTSSRGRGTPAPDQFRPGPGGRLDVHTKRRRPPAGRERSGVSTARIHARGTATPLGAGPRPEFLAGKVSAALAGSRTARQVGLRNQPPRPEWQAHPRGVGADRVRVPGTAMSRRLCAGHLPAKGSRGGTAQERRTVAAGRAGLRDRHLRSRSPYRYNLLVTPATHHSRLGTGRARHPPGVHDDDPSRRHRGHRRDRPARPRPRKRRQMGNRASDHTARRHDALAAFTLADIL